MFFKPLISTWNISEHNVDRSIVCSGSQNVKGTAISSSWWNVKLRDWQGNHSLEVKQRLWRWKCFDALVRWCNWKMPLGEKCWQCGPIREADRTGKKRKHDLTNFNTYDLVMQMVKWAGMEKNPWFCEGSEKWRVKTWRNPEVSPSRFWRWWTSLQSLLFCQALVS